MTEHEKRGEALRTLSKSTVLQYIQNTPECRPNAEGKRLASIFRECGFDWGERQNATSSNQQYWVVALMRDLEAEGRVERVTDSGPWRLC